MPGQGGARGISSRAMHRGSSRRVATLVLAGAVVLPAWGSCSASKQVDVPGVDGGSPPDSAPDADGPSGTGGFASPCEELVLQWCGRENLDAAGGCEDSPACELARLLRETDSGKCSDRLAETGKACTAGMVCADLALKCCGSGDGGGPCADQAPCELARQVAAQGDATSCRQAAHDNASFPRCAAR